ncbi:MAG: hypothetical protein JNK76_08605 [Planctomycetales bacterium]|nr:hypothetical protein [Planctomycetales bacterium]
MTKEEVDALRRLGDDEADRYIDTFESTSGTAPVEQKLSLTSRLMTGSLARLSGGFLAEGGDGGTIRQNGRLAERKEC